MPSMGEWWIEGMEMYINVNVNVNVNIFYSTERPPTQTKLTGLQVWQNTTEHSVCFPPLSLQTQWLFVMTMQFVPECGQTLRSSVAENPKVNLVHWALDIKTCGQ
jgi:hypothetical protein